MFLERMWVHYFGMPYGFMDFDVTRYTKQNKMAA